MTVNFTALGAASRWKFPPSGWDKRFSLKQSNGAKANGARAKIGGENASDDREKDSIVDTNK